MTQKLDGRYDHTKPWNDQRLWTGKDSWDRFRSPIKPDEVAKRWTYNGPFASNAERLTQQALMVASIPGADIQQMVRPPLPQIQLFPDRFVGERTQPTIDDIVTIDRNYTEPRVTWFSGGVGSYQAASRNALGSN